MIDPDMIPNADQHLREYQALQPPKIVFGAGSHELLAAGMMKLTIGIVIMSVMLLPGLGCNLLSLSSAIANAE